MLLVNELLVTVLKKCDFASYHGELLAVALYFPIVIPVIFLATSALGMTMAYVYGLVSAMALFAVGICLSAALEKLTIHKNVVKGAVVKGALILLAAGLVIFLIVSLSATNASVNLQGKQNIAKLPYDDALVYVSDMEGNTEYRVYDLNAYGALKKYAPAMDYNGEYYAGEGEGPDVGLTVLSAANGNVLSVKKNAEDSLVYLDFNNINAESFTVDDGITVHTYYFEDSETYSIKLHSECTVTVNGGSADLDYKEVLRDFDTLIPKEYATDTEKLHFNLWLTADYTLGN